MGEEVTAGSFPRGQRTRYRQRLQANLDEFAKFLATAQFADEGTIGLEMEINLVDSAFQPSLRNTDVLERIADPLFQTELGAFNIEMNYPVLTIAGRGLAELEQGLRDRLNRAEERAAAGGAHLMLVGALPTLTQQLIEGQDWRSPGNRYAALNDSILAARGEDVQLDISGADTLCLTVASVAPEAACTSAQLHLQVSPHNFPAAWNASQVIAGPQVALAANSPTFLGRRLWHETRVELFRQAVDTRTPEMVNQGVRPRVWFGERWITSIFDLLEENVRYFPALLPELREDAGRPERTQSGAPVLHELRLHNGTIYRWNRPIYDPGGAQPHLRVENRILPAGPTIVDTVANAAFYYGLVEALQQEERPLWSRMSFEGAEENFHACARDGLGAVVYWPQVGRVPVDELIVKYLLPRVTLGLQRLDVDPELVERYVGVLHERAVTGQTGAQWQLDCLAQIEGRAAGEGAAGEGAAGEGARLDRAGALAEMARRYSARSHSNVPVHSWNLQG